MTFEMDERLINQPISVTLEETEDGWMFVGRAANYPDVATYGNYPGEAYWMVADVIEGLQALTAEIQATGK